MKVDPNEPVNSYVEVVFCHVDRLELPDGSTTALAELGGDESAFGKFCATLDPNRCYLEAIVPEEAARPLYFRAREVAGVRGFLMQALIDTPERLQQRWEYYRQARKAGAEAGEENVA